jgi:hypothetical protein
MAHPDETDTWELWRQDDNGNRAVVARGSREDLERQRLQFEALGHKQMYWVAPARRRPDSG